MLSYGHGCGGVDLGGRVRTTRYRIPDLCVLLSAPKTKYLREAAFLAIEILSEDDSMSKTIEKLDEYDQKGVAHIWLIDPRLRRISTYSGGSLTEVKDTEVATVDPCLILTRDEIFRQ
jgi:Uma2 family endonuclease